MKKSMKKSGVQRTVSPAPVAAVVKTEKKSFVQKLLGTFSTARFGLVKFYGAEEKPAGAMSIDVADVYEWYVLELGPLKFAFNVGRKV